LRHPICVCIKCHQNILWLDSVVYILSFSRYSLLFHSEHFLATCLCPYVVNRRVSRLKVNVYSRHILLFALEYFHGSSCACIEHVVPLFSNLFQGPEITPFLDQKYHPVHCSFCCEVYSNVNHLKQSSTVGTFQEVM
jgi:hypothetical protein